MIWLFDQMTSAKWPEDKLKVAIMIMTCWKNDKLKNDLLAKWLVDIWMVVQMICLPKYQMKNDWLPKIPICKMTIWQIMHLTK